MPTCSPAAGEYFRVVDLAAAFFAAGAFFAVALAGVRFSGLCLVAVFLAADFADFFAAVGFFAAVDFFLELDFFAEEADVAEEDFFAEELFEGFAPARSFS